MIPRFLILALLAAAGCGADVSAGERLPCVYSPRASPQNPEPQLDGFADCAIRENGERGQSVGAEAVRADVVPLAVDGGDLGQRTGLQPTGKARGARGTVCVVAQRAR